MDRRRWKLDAEIGIGLAVVILLVMSVGFVFAATKIAKPPVKRAVPKAAVKKPVAKPPVKKAVVPVKPAAKPPAPKPTVSPVKPPQTTPTPAPAVIVPLPPPSGNSSDY